MKKFTALHLSDLHLSRAHAQLQQRAVRALCQDIADYRDAGHLIDAIFFTGELIATETPPSYVYQHVIQPLLAAASMPGARFYLVPRSQGREGAGVDAFTEAGFSFFSTPGTADAEQRAVYQNVHAVFHRHQRTGDGNTLMQALGALFDSRPAAPGDAGGIFDGYAILEFQGAPAPRWAVTRRRYDHARQAFEPGAGASRDVAADLAARRGRFDRQLLSHAVSGIAPKSLQAMFVEPPISNLSRSKNGDDGAAFQARSLAELAANGKAVFFVGRDESGKSTLLNYLCLQAATPYAFQVDLTSCAATGRAALLAAVARAGGGAYGAADGAAVGAMLQQGGALLCFDNLCLEHEGTLAALAALMAEFGACKFMFSIGEGRESGLERKFLSRLGTEADVVYLHSYGARQIRQLAKNWFGAALDTVAPRLDDMLRGVARSDIAQTPFLVSMLLCMAEKNLPFSAVNRAEVIAWFTNGLLGTAPGVALRRDFLIEASYFLFESKRLSLKSGQWRQFTADYLGVKGAPLRATALLAELCAQGLLAEADGEIMFAFDCYRTFFLAQKFDTSIDLMRYAFTQQGFLELQSELDIYTGLHQDAIEVLTASDRPPEPGAKPAVTAPYFPDLGRYEDRFHGGMLEVQRNDAVAGSARTDTQIN